jgi:formamidopyrimidine-DNA glycosylase
VPELPELEALRLKLGPELEGQMVTAAEVNPKKAHLLRYPVEDFAREVPARRIERMWRRGKHLVFDFGQRKLVINPMLGGRFQLDEADTKAPATEVFSLRLEGKRALRYTDFRDMGRIYWVEDPAREVPAWAEMGPEADSVGELGMDWFRKQLRRYRDELKDLLRNQSFLAGVGNAYSDEALHVAKMSPFKPAGKLSSAEATRLYEALVTVLRDAADRSEGLPASGLKGEKKSGLRVHGRTGQPCPACGDTVREVAFATKSLQYCATCQTGGKPLADRRLSRLLK